MLTVVHENDQSNDDSGRSLLDEIVRDGARQMLAAALQAEVAAYIDQFADQVNEDGHRLVVRNGYHTERDVLTAAGAVTVKVPRVNDKRIDPDTGERQRFSSSILPAWVRKSPQMNEVLPLLYLHGLSTSDFGPALEQFLGSGAGLSASSITRLTTQWQDEAKTFQDRDLSGTDFVYLWVDGIHLKVRLDQEKLCLLVELPPVSRRLCYLDPAPSGWRVAGRCCCRLACQAASYSSGERPSRPCWILRGLYHPSM